MNQQQQKMGYDQFNAALQLVLECNVHLLTRLPRDELYELSAKLQMHGDSLLNQQTLSLEQAKFYRRILASLIDRIALQRSPGPLDLDPEV